MKEKNNSKNTIGRYAAVALLGAVVILNGQQAEGKLLEPEQALEKYQDLLFAPAADLEWFQDAHFGVFMHWGPSSLEGCEISWGRQGSRGSDGYAESGIPEETYNNLYKQFIPVNFDADA